MARTARLELEVDPSRAKAGASTADKELRGLKQTAADVFNELRNLGRGASDAGSGMNAAARSASTADRELRKAGNAAEQATREMRQLNRESSGLYGAGRRGAQGINSMVESMSALRGIAAVGLLVGLTKEMLDGADAVRGWNAQLKLAIAPTTSLAAATNDVRRIAADTRSSIDTTNDLYAKFSRSSRDLGKSQEDAGRATATFAKTLKISGADTAAAESVTRQFGQALASGTLRGDEFNSMMEGSPRTARLLADSLGVNIGQLRNMAAEGELTADKLYTALTDKKFTATIDAEFKEIPVTFGDAMTRVKDASTITFAAFDRGGEYSQALINFMMGGVENLDTIEKKAQEAGTEFRATFAGLADVFMPVTSAANAFFDQFDIRIVSSREQFASILGVWDKIQNADIGFDRFYTGIQNGAANTMNRAIDRAGGGKKFDVWQMPEWSDKAGVYRRGYDQQASISTNRAADAKLTAAIPQYMQRQELGAWTRGAYLDNAKPKPADTGKEIGKTMSGAELDKALAGIGAVITSRGRSMAQQQAQIDKWTREDPTTRGIRPAAVDKSDHVVNGDRTRDIARGPGISLGSITAAVGKDNIKQLINEGDHFHLALKGKGGAGGGGGKSDVEKEADRQERLAKKRKEDEADFWQQLKDQGEAAAMLPREAEKFNAQLKLRKVLNDGNVAGERELTKEQKLQIDQLLQAKNLREFQGSARKAALSDAQEQLRLEDEGQVIARSTVETEADNLAIQQKLWPIKLDAMNRGLSLQDETVKGVLREAEARERGNMELEKRNRLIQEGVDVARQYGGPGVQQDADRADLNQKKVAAGEAVWAGRITPEVYEATVKGLDQAIYEVDNRFVYQFSASVDALAHQFGGKLGAAAQGVANILGTVTAQSKGDFTKSGVIGSVIDLFGGANGNPVKDAATKASQDTMSSLMNGSAISNPIKSLSSSFGSFKSDLGDMFGKGGNFTKGLGSVLGKAGMGASIGAATSQIADLVGIKLNKKGSQVGGAIGGAAFGPLGAIGGSVVGGLLGNLLSKPKYGTASLTGGGADGIRLNGNSSSAQKGAGTLGGAVQSGLQTVADQLGAQLGNYAVSIGMYKDKYRVSTTGFSGRLGNQGSKNDALGIKDFGTDGEAAAILFAIQDAIKDGALQGLSPTISKIISNAGDNLDKAVADALTFKSIQDQARQLTDPINFALEELNKSFTGVSDIMRNAGATSEEWANAEKVYQNQRSQIIEQGNNSALKEMREYLFSLNGGTSSPLSPELRLSASRAELDRLDATKASGGAVSFDSYKSAADAFLAASRDKNGSGLDYFADLKRVTDSVQGMVDKTVAATVTTPELNLSPVVTSIDGQTTQLLDALNQINATLANGGGGYSPPAAAAINPGKFAVSLDEPRYAAYY